MKPLFFATPAELRAWFETHHSTATELRCGFYKRASGKPSITWQQCVDEALCFGWIDGVRHSLGPDAHTNRLTPRRKGSNWSAINVARVEALIKDKRMTPAGLKAFEARTAARTGVYSHERNETAAFTPDQRKKLEANQKAAAFFSAQAPWYQRAATHWVISAKKEETRARRLAQLVKDSAAGRRIAPLAPRKSKDL